MSKQIKGDDLGSSLFSDRERMELWFSANWKKCIVWAFAIIAAAVVVVILSSYVRSKDAEFRQKLGSAPVAELADVIAQDPDHEAVPAARLRLANGLLAKGDVNGAKAEFEKLAGDVNAAVALQENGKIGAACCVELLGDAKGAMNSYQALAMDAANSMPLRAEAGFHAARLLMDAGDRAGAEKVLNSVLAGKDAAEQSYYLVLCDSMLKKIAVPQDGKK